MYEVSRHLIEKALEVFKGEDGKTKYFQRLLKNIDSLSNKLSDRIEINEKKLADSLAISKHTFPSMPTYVRDEILRYKDLMVSHQIKKPSGLDYIKKNISKS